MQRASRSLEQLRAQALAGDEEALDELLLRTLSAPPAHVGKRSKKRRGRKPGSGSYDALDEPLLNDMAELLTSGEEYFVSEAAWRVVQKAAGHGTEFNKTRRLIRKYEKSGRPIPELNDQRHVTLDWAAISI